METCIRYLESGEKGRSRKLWEQAFFEDSKEFDDYYFREKIQDNQILVKEEDRRILSMLHRNPYLVKVKEKTYRLDYIVGVATDQDRRHEGHMTDLLCRMMKDMYEKRVPFTFLMPASESIYYPFDFRFIFSQPVWKADWKEHDKIEEVPAGRLENGEEIARWMNHWLEQRYQVYTKRTKEYVERLDEELASEKGRWSFLYRKDRLSGIRCEWGLREREQRLLYEEAADMSTAERYKPAIMGRIICLPEFIKTISLKPDCPQEEWSVKICVSDQWVEENNGIWIWKLNKQGSGLKRPDGWEPDRNKKDTADGRILQKPEPEAGTTLEIGEMMEWLSGYRPFLKEKWMDWIQPWQGVFLDEIV